MLAPEKNPPTETQPAEFKQVSIPLIRKIFPSLSGPEASLTVKTDVIPPIPTSIPKPPKYRSLDDLSIFET
jgi:hypothetical protein